MTLEVDENRFGLYDPSTHAVIDEMVWEGNFASWRFIDFIHQAIEWENVNFVTIPLFLGDPSRWDFKENLKHADMTHLEFYGQAQLV
jgi:hypothetical protein